MYVDESGTEQTREKSRYFVVSGAVVHENHVANLERCVDRISNERFPTKFKGLEIHMHNIYKGKREFAGITPSEIQDTLSGVYRSLLQVDFSTITIVIDKKRWILSKHFKYDILQSAYTFLIERFEKFLQKNSNKGLVRIDKVSNKSNALSAKDKKILTTINLLRTHGSYWTPVRGLVEPPLFLASSDCRGLQAADTIAYGTNLHIKEPPAPEMCEVAIRQKAQKRPDGRIDGYGITVYPK